MNKILIISILIMNNLFANYLIVDDASIGTIQKKIVINNITQKFSPNSLKVGTNSVIHTIPIYIKSDSNEKIMMNLLHLSNLKNREDNQEITTSFFYQKIDRNEVPIQENTPFILSVNPFQRDGNTIVGHIIVKAINLSATQTVGNYELRTALQVSLGKRTSRLSTLSLTGQVPLIAIAGFSEIPLFQSGQRFNSTSINYGILKLWQKNEIKKNLFVRSNSHKSFRISFKTSDLVHQIYPSHRIAMKYIYRPNNGNEVLINNTNYFTAISSKNDGRKIGQMKFETEKLNDSHLAGEYRANINITITLE